MSATFDSSRWPHADDLLDQALLLPLPDRDAFLLKSAGNDPELLAALRSILDEASREDDFLAPGGAISGSLGAEIVREIDGRHPAANALTPGARIEQYEILEAIGRGGMGEVYRARDTRLSRDVAIKVLPDHLARDPERVARFRREARTLAALNHSGIGAIYGVAEDGSREALVLELVEGPTLAERLGGRALPLEDALAIGRRLAEAIEAAHARGILHRDLKPANIKVKDDGSVKILDFGLAKALAPGPGELAVDLSGEQPGLVLGTAAYMSPEQVRAQELDERTDIWAFGCVLFEMLTGTRAFPGTSTPEVIANVLERDPSFDQLPSATPPSIRRLLRRTLEKPLRRRLGYIGDGILDFDDAEAAPAEVVATKPRSWLRVIGLTAAIVVTAIAAVALWRRDAPVPATTSRFVLPLPTGDTPVAGFQPAVAFSPDGQTIVYRARRNGVVQLFRRSLQNLEPEAIPGTENGTSPFFSPDGQWLGFDSDGVIKRVGLAGGPPVVICNAPGGVTATWQRDSIVFATNTSRVLQQVPASGGEPVSLTSLDQIRGDTLHLLPQALPDGRALLFTIVSGASRHIALRFESGEIRVIAEGTHARYLPTGYLVFWREGSLWGVGFDIRTMAVTGAAVPLVLDIQHTDNTVLHFDVAGNGSLVYLPAGEDGDIQRLVWIDRDGRETAANIDARPYTRISLSPDGTQVAFAMRERGNTDVWVADFMRPTLTRLTFDPTIETSPTWSRDGKSVTFRSEKEGPGVFRRDAQGAGPIERLTETDGPIHSPYSWTPDGRTLLFAVFRSFRQQAIASVTPPDRTVHVLLDGDFAQLDPQVSPDGRWLAYQSDESRRFEVYVRPFPDVRSARWQVSTGGGTSPRWSPDGRELLFLDEQGLLSVPVPRASTFAAAAQRRIVKVKPFGGRLGADFEVSPDGRRFLFILAGPPTAVRAAQFIFVQHWVEDLRSKIAQTR